MPRQRIGTGANFVFPPGTIQDSAEVDNLHNVNGNVNYQINAQQVVTIPIRPNEENVINHVYGQQLTVWNNCPNSIEIVY